MFTGIVEHQGRIAAIRKEAWGVRLEIDTCGWAHVPHDGDSISVNGCCLTVVGTPAAGDPLRFDVVPQTLSLTTIGTLRAGELVNLEHAATAATLMGGHIVQGHVDGVGRVLAVGTEGGEWRTRIAAPEAILEHAVERGSIAVDGVSLTLARVGDGWFEVALIPATLAKTTLRDRVAGTSVNLESDVLAKMVAERVRRALAAASPRP
ncbi:MAG: riboflavin synthase alpha chain [Planctomycetota bacterium]|jgi:riboflavin synthase